MLKQLIINVHLKQISQRYLSSTLVPDQPQILIKLIIVHLWPVRDKDSHRGVELIYPKLTYVKYSCHEDLNALCIMIRILSQMARWLRQQNYFRIGRIEDGPFRIADESLNWEDLIPVTRTFRNSVLYITLSEGGDWTSEHTPLTEKLPAPEVRGWSCGIKTMYWEWNCVP